MPIAPRTYIIIDGRACDKRTSPAATREKLTVWLSLGIVPSGKPVSRRCPPPHEDINNAKPTITELDDRSRERIQRDRANALGPDTRRHACVVRADYLKFQELLGFSGFLITLDQRSTFPIRLERGCRGSPFFLALGKPVGLDPRLDPWNGGAKNDQIQRLAIPRKALLVRNS